MWQLHLTSAGVGRLLEASITRLKETMQGCNVSVFWRLQHHSITLDCIGC